LFAQRILAHESFPAWWWNQAYLAAVQEPAKITFLSFDFLHCLLVIFLPEDVPEGTKRVEGMEWRHPKTRMF